MQAAFKECEHEEITEKNKIEGNIVVAKCKVYFIRHSFTLFLHTILFLKILAFPVCGIHLGTCAG